MYSTRYAAGFLYVGRRRVAPVAVALLALYVWISCSLRASQSTELLYFGEARAAVEKDSADLDRFSWREHANADPGSPYHSDYLPYHWDYTYPKPVPAKAWQHLLNRHVGLQKEICAGTLPLRALVYYCRKPCYALADSTRGMLIAYALAAITKRAFIIASPEYYPVKTYYDVADPAALLPGEEGTVDWRLESCPAVNKHVSESDTDYQPLPHEVHIREDSGVMALWRDSTITTLQKSDLSMGRDWPCTKMKSFSKDYEDTNIVLFESNHHGDCLKDFLKHYSNELQLPELRFTHGPPFRLFNRRLLRIRSDIEEDSDRFLLSEKMDLSHSLCVHVRTGFFPSDHVAGFKQSGPLRDFVSCASDVERLMRKEVPLSPDVTIPWLVISDDAKMASDFGDYMHKEQVPGKRRIVGTNDAGIGPIISLLDVNSESTRSPDAMAGIRRVAFDFHLLSRCKYFLAGQSGYAGLAAMLGADWSEKKAFVVGQKFMDVIPTFLHNNRTCRRYVPSSGQ